MKLDRAESVGIGAALTLHVALVAALSLQLARMDTAPEPPAIVVEFVDEVGLVAAAPELATAPTPAEPEPAVDPLDAPPLEPVEPAPPTVTPTPSPRAEPTPPRPAQERPRPRSRREPGNLDNILDDVAEGDRVTPGSNAPVMDAAAAQNIAQLISRQIQPCANRQIDPGPGANEISVTLNLRLTRTGSLARPPQVVRTRGVTPFNEKYEQRVKDLAIAAYTGCSPLRGLPPELYDVPRGWSNINMTYRLP